MLDKWSMYKRGNAENIYKTFSKDEKKFMEEYLQWRKARGCKDEEKLMDIRREIIQTIDVLGKDYKNLGIAIDYKNINISNKENIPLKIFRNLIAVIKSSDRSDGWKNCIQCDIKLFLQLKFRDWSIRFNGFDDIQFIKTSNSKKVNTKTIYKQPDIEKMMQHEPQMYYKAFLMTQYEGGLRTIEARFLKWEDIKLNVDGDISEVSIYATKTKKARTIFLKEATFYLKKLKEEQDNLNQKSVYVFPSKTNLNEPANKGTINDWFAVLSQKALGRKGWNYLLRHSKATELYTLADEGKISDATASRFMGHAKNMKEVYLHLNSDKIKQMLKDQIYHIEELPPEKKAELEKQINELREFYLELKGENEALKSWIKQDYDEDFQKQLNKLPKKKQKIAKQKIEKFTKMINERN